MPYHTQQRASKICLKLDTLRITNSYMSYSVYMFTKKNLSDYTEA